MINILQTVTAVPDSTIAAAAARAESAKAEMIDKIANSTPSELLADLIEKSIQFGLKLVAAVLVYIIGGYLIKWVKKLLAKTFARKKTDPSIVSFMTSFVSVILWIVLIVIVISTLGVETTSLAALLAAGGVAIGMALSGTVQNFAGGVMILTFKPFKIGDYIEAQGNAGTVSDINITNTKIVTYDNRVVVLPNGTLSSGVIVNYSKQEWRRVDLTVSVEYGSDAGTVKEALLDIASQDPRVMTAEQGAPDDPFAGVTKLNSSSVDFSYRLWVRTADYWGVYFDINEKVYTELPKRGIGFPFPQVSVHMAEKKS